MSRSKVVFPAELMPAVNIEHIDECVGRHACQCCVRMQMCIKMLLMSLLITSCSTEMMPTNGDVSHSKLRHFFCCYSCIQPWNPDSVAKFKQRHQSAMNEWCCWDVARGKGLPTPGGPSSRIEPACLLAALPVFASSANLSISMVATPAHQTGQSWHHRRGYDDRDHLGNKSERFFPVVTVGSPLKFTVWHNKNMYR